MHMGQQVSLIERLKSELAETKVKSQKLETEQEKKSAIRHNKQMEEIRNRHVRHTDRQQSGCCQLSMCVSLRWGH